MAIVYFCLMLRALVLKFCENALVMLLCLWIFLFMCLTHVIFPFSLCIVLACLSATLIGLCSAFLVSNGFCHDSGITVAYSAPTRHGCLKVVENNYCASKRGIWISHFLTWIFYWCLNFGPFQSFFLQFLSNCFSLFIFFWRFIKVIAKWSLSCEAYGATCWNLLYCWI